VAPPEVSVGQVAVPYGAVEPVAYGESVWLPGLAYVESEYGE
jgi:hypothetical protein